MNNLVIYADESGTHEGSEHSYLAGWIADENFWTGFIERWQAVLIKYKVECFHFTEWAKACYVRNHPEKEHSHDPKRLKHLSSSELDGFFKELSDLLVAPELEFEISILERKKFLDDKQSANPRYPRHVYEKNPEIYLTENFIDKCGTRMLEVWELRGKHIDSVKFIFDNRNDKEWNQSIKNVASEFVKWGWNFKPIEFKTKMEAIPIQAADMLAYRSHQFTVNMGKGKVLTKPISALDEIIGKRVHCPPGWVRHSEQKEPFGYKSLKDATTGIPPIPKEQILKHLHNAQFSVRRYMSNIGLKNKAVYSGTYVNCCGHNGILTAGHCAEAFLSEEAFSLGVKETKHLLIAKPSDFEHVQIGFDAADGYTLDGPDLSFLIIKSNDLVDVLKGQNIDFFNLDRQDVNLFSEPLAKFNWYVAGCPRETVHDAKEQINGEEYTIIHSTASGFQCNLIEMETRGDFDYVKLDAPSGQHDFPDDYNGVSGGGIWYLRFVTKDGKVYSIEPILAGVSVWQSEESNGQRKITGHGYNSIYGCVRQILAAKKTVN